MDKVIEAVKSLLDKVTFLPNYELKLAIAGGILILLVFLIALLVAAGSKINSLRKRILSSTKQIGAVGIISEENIDVVYNELNKLPEPVSKGWSCFMDQRFGYPSDYMPANDILSLRTYKGKNTVGKVMLNILSLAILCLISFFALDLCYADFIRVGIVDFTANFALVASIIATILVPCLVWLICILLLGLRYDKQLKRLEMTYASFQDILDEKVVVYATEEEAFVSENLEEIKKKVDELVSGRMEDLEVVEVITSPKVEEVEIISTDEVETAVEEEPIPVEAEVVAAQPQKATPMTKEEEKRYLEILLVVVDNAINDDNTSLEDLESIATLILTAKSEGFSDPADQAILDTCLEKIADQYFK